MNWLVKWYYFDADEQNNTFIKSKILKLCGTYEEAYKIMVDFIHAPSCHGWFRVEKN